MPTDPPDWNIFHKIYEASPVDKAKPHGWIQWKGTDVCIDLHCECGHHGHHDGDFLYHYECPQCKKRWALDPNVTLFLLDEAQINFIRQHHVSFKSDTEQFGMTPQAAVWRLQECECYNAGLRCEGCSIAVNVLSQLFAHEGSDKIGVIKEFIPAQLLPGDNTFPNEATYQASIRWENADVRYKAGKKGAEWTLVPVKRGEPGFDDAPFLLLEEKSDA